MAEKGITTREITNLLTRSAHGSLQDYVPVATQACREHAEFFAHLIAWSRFNCQIRDANVAMPVISLCVPYPEDFINNSLAHIALLPPRDLLRGVRFARGLNTGVSRHMLRIRKLVKRYLRHRERNWALWEKSVVQHRASMKELYSLIRIKPMALADEILFKEKAPKGTVFEAIRNLKNMSAAEAAGTIVERRIPFLIAVGALGEKSKDPDVVLSLIQRMSPSELVNNTKSLERMGMNNNPALRAAYQEALGRAAGSKKNTLKASKAVEAVEDEGLREKLKGLQEKQIKAAGGIDGNWLILGDASPSMTNCIDVAKMVAGALAKFVTGKVHLVFFHSTPRYFDVTGMDYDAIQKMTKFVLSAGGTSIGCGLQYIMEKKIEVDGIAVVSDAKENTAPMFVDAYERYSKMVDRRVPVYLFRFHTTMTGGTDRDLADSMRLAGFDMQEFDLRHGKADYYSVANFTQLMKASRYALDDLIFQTPLMELDDVLSKPQVEVAV